MPLLLLQATQEWLTTPAARDEYERFKSYSSTVRTLFSEGDRREGGGGLGHDTVGAVALDSAGDVRAQT